MKNIGLILILFVFISCNKKEIEEDIKYHSVDSDIAKIDLILKKDHSFNLSMKMFSDLDSQDSTTEVESLAGKWEISQEEFILSFDKNFKIKELFNQAYDPDKTVRIINAQDVSFNKDAGEIIIWGISCIKD